MPEHVLSFSAMWRPLIALVIAAAVVMGSPGPATISVTAVGAAFGFRRSLGYLAGITLGAILVLFAVAMGMVAALLAVPQLASVLTAVSAAYMLYLAYRIATAPPLARRSGEVAAPSFASGLVLGVANPKAYVAITAVFAGSTLVTGAQALDAVLKTAVLSVMIVTIHVCWLMVGTSFSRIFHDPASSRIANILFAASLVVVTLLALLR